MIRPTVRGQRAGITLTEILISILIMGVGMLSLFTLFPLGLQRLRDAARSSRSAMLIETATSEIGSRDLLYKPSFSISGYPFDPFTEDPASAGEAGAIVTGLDRVTYNPGYTGLRGGTGLTVCYDPLWWYQVFVANGAQPNLNSGTEFRFGSGVGLIRSEGSAPSAHGLQRLTNFPLYTDPTFGPQTDPAALFASPDDLVMQTDGTPSPAQGRGSPLVPDLSTGGRMNDYSYTWIFTGKQTDVSNGTIFDGDIVVFHNRPFAIEQRNGVNTAAGETVVEAIWGYSATLDPNLIGNYGRNNRTVLLRWPVNQPDPDVRAGGWIADITYERFNATELNRFYPPNSFGTFPAQRCFWYRIVKKTDPSGDTDPTLTSGQYRSMVVTLGSDVRAKTELLPTGRSAAHVNAALVCPYVVNVVSRVFYTR
jgi:type II secretory pathway pseudopilin PulG